MSLFVTGTDTGVGKTYITQLLIEALRHQRVDAIGFKPIASGDRQDAATLAAASGDLPLDEINPVFLQNPLAPHAAAMLENREISLDSLVQHYQKLAKNHQTIIVEGAGGWLVPINASQTIADLAAALQLPVLLVTANRLGCINHTLLTLQAIQQKGLTCIGIILNELEDELDTVKITNRALLEELANVPILSHVIHAQNFLDLDDFPNLV